LHIVGPGPTDDERAAVDALLGPPESGWRGGVRDAARDGRTARGGSEAATKRDQLLPALHAVQDRIGWVSRGALNYICRRLTVPPAEAWGVLTFYHLLSSEPRPPVVAHVCDDIACRLKGAEAICTELEATVGPPATVGHRAEAKDGSGGVSAPPSPAGTPPDGKPSATWMRSPCLGLCDQAPAALVIGAGKTPVRLAITELSGADEIRRALESVRGRPPAGRPSPTLDALRRSVPQFGSPGLKLLRRVGSVNPASLDDYRASGGYRALARAIELGPEGVIAEVTASGLLGRGGAAFPAGRKWEAVAREAAQPHLVVCNADESEPGTFKDRVLMDGDPFALVEALTICGFATGAERGFIYVRGEYPTCEARLALAIAAARGALLLGENVAGAGFGFDLEIRRGAGAYICGEETALFNSIEGKRGEPRSKPPFPAQVGLFGKPTVVNNVETLANIPDIVLEGGAAWARVGTGSSTGTRLFCLSGHIASPGLYEMPFGTTLRALIELAGGVPGGRSIRGILLGGAAGVFVGPDQLDLPLTFEDARAAGATLGSGVVMVFDDTTNLVDTLMRIAEFFEDESCGQCVPCRVGAVRQHELLVRLRADGDGRRAHDLRLLGELGQAMRDASICGLGQTASSAIESAVAKLHLFRPGASA
jgi:NADH-quinone oxidoreductase subunit F